jgi:hypothetical protein
LASRPACRAAILLFHRGHEHSGRMAHLSDELDLPDFAVFAGMRAVTAARPASGFQPSLDLRARRPSWTISPAEWHRDPGHGRGRAKHRCGAGAIWVHDYRKSAALLGRVPQSVLLRHPA